MSERITLCALKETFAADNVAVLGGRSVSRVESGLGAWCVHLRLALMRACAPLPCPASTCIGKCCRTRFVSSCRRRQGSAVSRANTEAAWSRVAKARACQSHPLGGAHRERGAVRASCVACVWHHIQLFSVRFFRNGGWARE